MVETIGILGAGRVGTALARLLLGAGSSVLIAGSGDPRRIADRMRAAAPGAIPATAEHAASAGDPVILAVPLAKHRGLPVASLRGKLVIDAMNSWWEVDGVREAFTDPRTSSSETVQAFLPGSRIVKTLNHLAVDELEHGARPPGAPDRRGVAIAGDDPRDVERVARLVARIGFDPVVAGALADGVRFEPRTELFGADADAAEVRAMLERFPESARGRVVARARAHDRPGPDSHTPRGAAR